MVFSSFLTTLLVSGASLAAKGILGEIAKGSGKAAFAAIKERLSGEHGVKSLGLLEDAEKNDAFKTAIESELEGADLQKDRSLLDLSLKLQEALEQIPAETARAYDIDLENIRSGRDVLLEQIEGTLRARDVTTERDFTIRNVTTGRHRTS